MSGPDVPVNPKMLAWARKTAAATVERAASSAGVDVARITEWESGVAKPTLVQLRKLADLYKRPLAMFFLNELPVDFTIMKAFRRLPGSDDLTLSYELTSQLRESLQRREIALSLADAIGQDVPVFDGRAHLTDSPAEVAVEWRDRLGITAERQRSWGEDYAAFRAWRTAIEDLGVLTFQTTRVSTDEMRGLSMFEKKYPVVLLNGGDAVRARIFTLAHELAHLLLRSAVSKDSNEVIESISKEEVWCNAFAGALVAPEPLITFVPQKTAPEAFDWAALKTQANTLRASQDVVLRRLLDLGRLTRKEYEALRKKLASQNQSRAGGGPIPQDVLVVSRLGLPFTRMVVIAYRQAQITLSDLSDYLGVRVTHLPKIEARVFGDEAGAYA